MRLWMRNPDLPKSLPCRLTVSFLTLLLWSWCGVLAAQQSSENAIFWRISHEGRDAGFLLGTIHSEDPRVLDFTDTFMGQLKSCQVFAMEMVPDLPTLARLTDYMQYPDASTLKQTIGQDRFDRVMQALSSYQVPVDWKSKMKVWAVMMTLSVPPPETGFFMDLSLSLRAAGAGLKVEGLETLEQQLSFLEDMPMDYQLVLLDQALADYQSVGEIHARMVDAYLRDDLSVLSQLSDEQFTQLDSAIEEYFSKLGIKARNRRMVEHLLPLLQDSEVFVAIGALHLVGPDGVVALLRGQGYTLTPLPLPFAPSSLFGLNMIYCGKVEFGRISRSFSLNSGAIRLKRPKNTTQIGFPSLRSVKSDRQLASSGKMRE